MWRTLKWMMKFGEGHWFASFLPTLLTLAVIPAAHNILIL